MGDVIKIREDISIYNKDGTVTISEDFFDSLCDDALFLDALYENGVEQWEGFSFALKRYEADQ